MLIDLAAPPAQPVWWYACLYRVDCTELHVRIKTRLWIDARQMAAEALGVSDASEVYLRLDEPNAVD